MPGVRDVAVVDCQSGLEGGDLLLQARCQLQGGALLALHSAGGTMSAVHMSSNRKHHAAHSQYASTYR